MKVALVHDYLREFGGGERTLLALHELFPEAPIYTSFANKALVSMIKRGSSNQKLGKLDLRTSSLQRIPLIERLSKQVTFFYPLIFENFDLNNYDLVVSSSTIWAKGVITKPKTLHISYIHTPPRFLYHYPREMDKRTIKVLSPILKPFDNYLRIWDFSAAQRPDYLVANSETVAKRIRKFYRRDCLVIYPPVEIDKFRSSQIKEGSYFLVVSRLSRYKNVDIAIKACNELKIPLKVAGTGREERNLKRLAGSAVDFLGFVNDDDLVSYYANCRALICPVSDEDFGVVPVEAMAAGKPVIALKSGGVTESVVEKKTGAFFDKPEVSALVSTLKNFEPKMYNGEDCVRQAEKFSKERFLGEFKELVEAKLRNKVVE